MSYPIMYTSLFVILIGLKHLNTNSFHLKKVFATFRWAAPSHGSLDRSNATVLDTLLEWRARDVANHLADLLRSK